MVHHLSLEDVAAQYLQQHPQLKQRLEEKKKSDTAFAASADKQLELVYKTLLIMSLLICGILFTGWKIERSDLTVCKK